MKNQSQSPSEEKEIQNPEQFQMHRAGGHAAEGHAKQNDADGQDVEQENKYTAKEVQYADGEGTLLNKSVDELEDDDEETVSGPATT